MKKQTIYLAGKMSGLPEMNFPLFHATAERLREIGWEVVNTAEINPDKHLSWRECMRTDIAELVFCDAIFMIDGWEDSPGATLENLIAVRLGLDVHYQTEPVAAGPVTDLSTPWLAVTDWSAA